MIDLPTMAPIPPFIRRQKPAPSLACSDVPLQMGLARGWLVLFLLLALTGLYLAGPARLQMSGFATAVLLLHLAVGLVAAPLLLWAGIWCSVVRRSGLIGLIGRGEGKCVAGWLQSAGWLLLVVALFTGIGLIVVAARGGVADSLSLISHVGAGLASVGLLLGSSVRRTRAEGSAPDDGKPDRDSASARNGCGDSAVLAGSGVTPRTALATALILLFLAASGATVSTRPALESQYQRDSYYESLTVTNARQAHNALFPAATTVTAEAGARLRSSAYCGQAGCHPQAYQEWWGSAHQRAASRPGYRALVGRCVRQRGSAAGRWCEGCHAPAGLVNEARRPAPTRLGPSRSESSEGVNCFACHGIAKLTALSGNGRAELRLAGEYPFADSPDPRLRWLHRFLIRLRPGPHRWAFFKPELQTRSEGCAACHRTSYNLPQNGFKFLRTADDYGTWLSGPDSGQSIHAFSPPGAIRRCQDCHNVHYGGAQPWARRSGRRSSVQAKPHEQLDPRSRERFSGPVTVDLLALRRPTAVAGALEELIAPLDRSVPRLRSGEAVTVDVVVRNREVGHAFPAGTGDLQGGWVEFAVLDASGRLLLQSQNAGGGNGDAVEEDSGASHGGRSCLSDPGEHTYGLVALDRQGHRLEQGELWEMVTPLYHRTLLPGQPDADRRTIQPSEADVVHYRLRVPHATAGRITLRARLWCGPLTPAAARLDPAFVKRLMDEDTVVLPVAEVEIRSPGVGGRRLAGIPLNRTLATSERRPDGGSAHPVIRPSSSRPGIIDSALPGRFYDYGVGLLLQGDLPRARIAMRRVQTWAPSDVRGYLGLGRVFLTEGDLLAARGQFGLARRFAPKDPRPRAFLALTERRMGQYDRALDLLVPLVRDYPGDRLLWFDIGMSYYLAGRYEEGARAFETMLGIDPDDLAGHYNLMRCLRRLRRVPEAQREEVIYQALREDDDAKPIALGFLRRHPWADRETRTIHEHTLYEVGRSR
jgi:tetratricopeptide repeat protein/cytochrome c554/c'-like protein